MGKKELIIGSIMAGLAVMIGAFGAHALHGILTEHGRVETFETATQYHLYHALAILIVGLLLKNNAHKLLKLVSILFFAGILIFSGSLYILSVSNLTWLGAITPLGGLAFITGWVLLVVYFIRSY